MRERRRFDVLVVGAGPAGMAAAYAASQAKIRIGVVDDNPRPGGQIWRGGVLKAASANAIPWFERFASAGVALLAGTRVVDQPQPGLLLATSGDETFELQFDKLVLATGARERFLPFPGWTLPNVMGAGGLEAMVRGGLLIANKRVVVAGSGPLLIAVAAELQSKGAEIPLIAEQAPRSRLSQFGLALALEPAKLVQGAGLWNHLRGVRYAASTWPVAALGKEKLEAVVLHSGGKQWTEPCDYLACGFGLVPNLELPTVLGCALRNGFLAVDEWQETSLKGVYAAGEPTGIGGLDLALAGGQIAGYAATGNIEQARRCFGARRRALAFKDRLERAFTLRSELRALATPETLVCRCEDVTLGRMKDHTSWRAAKLATRCGMGPCQGRVCGPAVEFILGWQGKTVRPPVFPAQVEDFCGDDEPSRPDQST
ncbi:MAG TPA: FAD/NAD(P)-binding oxidoreductase [Bryobacteraceae bacterium]|nr:FAD/NAD(P)-binding oxidoreductase [Bryobacteraceae bacterium]